MKKILNLLIIFMFFMFLFTMGFISSQTESCSITTRDSCSGTIVMGLSNSTNAHGNVGAGGSSPNVLCCNFAGSLTCDGNNKIIGLSNAINAHAEVPDPDTIRYSTNNVCYGDLSCISTALDCASTPNNHLQIFSLSSSTNAHIGPIGGNYDTNICCVSGSSDEPPISSQQVRWTNSLDETISNISIIVGTTSVKLVLENSGLAQGIVIEFNISEADIFPNPDDFIRTITATIDSNGKAVATWTITQADLDKTVDLNEFYFEVNGETSGFLEIIVLEENCISVNFCRDYTTQLMCDNDIDYCEVGDVSVNEDGSVDCTDAGIECGCSWDGTQSENQCGPQFSVLLTINGTQTNIGTCRYQETSNDNCDDGFLTYSWTATWSGSAETTPGECISGSKTIECPAQIQLPFFGIYNFIITLLIIASIYIILIRTGRKFN